ncbi:MAG TPA: hydantoinase/oxoprolinase family protein [Chloroflexi bacterium]|nr:hydantoinase/oxoprolinase family protein [Chloroflexota bacterium]
MTIALGIDTGGTYTDAVLVDHDSGAVLATAKALTTRHDLAIGIGEAIASVLDGEAISTDDVQLVALSTTLATNAIVEGQGSPICLLLIGYDRDLLRHYGFESELVTPNVVYLRGGHDGVGDEIAPLDEEGAREAILAWQDQVEAFAVSGYFGVRNPAHERRVRDLVRDMTGLPVACGHELTTRLNSVRRATTVALNARLIPLLRELISTVRRTLEELGISAPLMVVKGDGSLVRAAWAMYRPIETILSGPAASVVGAWYLAKQRDVWVVDVGGTTTDIAMLQDGQPRKNLEGARVGRWRTMVEAVDVHTVGLGGDSQVQVHSDPAAGPGWLSIGPRRVVPLCMLASQYPQVVSELQRQVTEERGSDLAGQFLLRLRQDRLASHGSDRELGHYLGDEPQALIGLAAQMRYTFLLQRQIEELAAEQLVLQAGFTPTDALHVLERLHLGDAKAARLGADLLAARAGLSPEAFCERVTTGVSDRVATELVSKVLSDEEQLPRWEQEPTAAALLTRALNDTAESSNLGCQLALKQPIVAIGAPVEAYMPLTARRLNTELIIPEHAGVANALGAVVGGIVQQVHVLIQPLAETSATAFRVHLPDGVRDLDTLEESVAYARRVVPGQLTVQARQAGAEQIEVQMVRVDQVAPVRGSWGKHIYLGTELTFTAVGRPSLTYTADSAAWTR